MGNWKVTAAITTYKRSWTSVLRAIDSVLGQSRPPEELLLIDDNDPDSSWSADIRGHAAERPAVRYVAMGKNSGVSAARNRAISEAAGDLLAYLDDDDEWLPGKLETQLRLFDEHPGIGLAFGTGIVLYADTGKQATNWQERIFRENPSFQDMLWTDYVGSASVPLMRVSLLRELGGFRTEGQPAVEDYELWIRLARVAPLWGVREPVFLKHEDSSEHVSGNLHRLFEGFRNIYRVNRADYSKNRHAEAGILWNIARCGVRSLDARVIPWVFRWAAARLREKAGDVG